MVTPDVQHDDDVVVIPESVTPRDAGVTLAELLSSFYLWLVLWLVLWAAIPALLFQWEPVLITSGSMGPTISAGDLILIHEPDEPDELAPGTVVTFNDPESPGALITHRIDGLREDGKYQTRGDANPRGDPDPVAPEDIEGVGRLLVPLVGLPILWLETSPTAFILFIGGTLASLLVATASNRVGRTRGIVGEGDDR